MLNNSSWQHQLLKLCKLNEDNALQFKYKDTKLKQRKASSAIMQFT